MSASPANAALRVNPASPVVFEFSDPIQRGTGKIIIKNVLGHVLADLDAASSDALVFAGSTLTINMPGGLLSGTQHYVTIPAGAIRDNEGLAYAGLPYYRFDTSGWQQPVEFNGTDGNDVLQGLSTNYVIYAGGGDDLIDSVYSGDHTIHGGSGMDTVSFGIGLNNFRISRNGGVTTVDFKGTEGGTSILHEVEKLRFANVAMDLGAREKFAPLPTAIVEKVSELYIAFFNRLPDVTGLSYWAAEMNAGMSIDAMANAFYQSALQYSTYTAYSSNMTNADFIDRIYRNVLGRTEGADAGGMAYWQAELTSGHATRGTLVTSILASAHTYKGNTEYGFVADLLDNKVAATKAIIVDWGVGATSEAFAYALGATLASVITPTSFAEALRVIGTSQADLLLA